jgi:adenylate cyclase
MNLGTRRLLLHVVADPAKARPRRMWVMDELSGEELAVRSGVTAEQLRRLVALGVITPTPQGRFRPSDIQRIRVVDTLSEAGFAPEQLSQLIATGAYDLDWASVVFPEPTAQLTTTLEETAAATGLPEDLAARLFDAWELPRPQPGQALRADDDELLHLAVPALKGFGRDETVLLAAARQLGDRLRGLAESQVRLFHTHVEERLAAQGHPDHSWSDDLNQVAASMMASLDRTLVLLYRRHFEHYVLEVTVLRAEAALERAGLARRRPVRPPSIAFLDLTGYTKLTEERGDRAAAELAGRLVEIVHEFAHRRGGRPVKLLGDGVMFHFPEPAQAVRCGLELVDRLPRVGLPWPGSGCTAARWCSRTTTTSAARSMSRPGSPTTPDRERSWSATRSWLTPTLWRRSALRPSGRSRSRGSAPRSPSTQLSMVADAGLLVAWQS